MLAYLLLITFVLFFAHIGKKHLLGRVLAFLIVALFVGLRKDVGTDYESYVDIYNLDYFYLEPGFNFIIILFNNWNLNESWMFMFFAILTYTFYFFTVETNRDIKNKYPLVLMFSLLTVSVTCNGIRQALAAAIFFFSYKFMKEKKCIPFIGLIVIAFMFHKSILFVIPFYFADKIRLNKQLYVLIYVFSFIFTSLDLAEIATPLQFLIKDNTRYMNLVEENYGQSYLSLGIIVEILSYAIILIVALHNNMHKNNPMLFNLLFALCVLMNMRVGASLMSRMMMYFVGFFYISIPYVGNEIKNPKFRRQFYALYIAWFIISNIKYIYWDKVSRMFPYHDVFDIF